MKKISLKTRILLYFIIVPILALMTAGILTLVDMFKLQEFTAKTGSDMTDEAVKEGQYAMRDEMLAELQMLADGQSTILELQMQRILSGMSDLEALYRDIYSGNYSSNDRGFVSGEKYSLNHSEDFTYISCPGNLNKKEAAERLQKMTMMRNAFKYSCAYNDYYVGMGIALPDGVFFKYDWFPVPLDYDARSSQWFKKALALKGKVVWLDPVRSESSNKLLLTFSKAVLINGKVEAVIVIDILPQSISSEFVVTRGTGCFAFLVAPSGNIVACEDIKTKKLIWQLSSEEKTELNNNIIKKINTGKKESFNTVFNGESMDVAFSPMSSGKWGVGVATPVDFIGSIAGKTVAKIKDNRNTYITSTHKYIKGNILLSFGAGLILAFAVISFAVWMALRFGKPIKQLESGIDDLSKRKLDRRIEINSNDEFNELGDTFNAMALELNRHINNLKDNIAHQERAKNELYVASDIQQSMLPDASLAFPDHDEFDIYAEMHPAKEVGGDFYDFFFIDDSCLFFTIGDVSGKGLSAALFMMRSLTLIRHEAEEGLPPDEIFVNVGNELEQNNESCMFFTGTCGLLDVQSGELLISNAGHPPPYLRKGNSFDAVEIENGLIVGALQLNKEQFHVKKITLNKGDTLFLYTDGVTEAFNNEAEEYQSERLHAVLESLPGANPREIVEKVSESVEDFRNNTPQTDDITMLAIKYYG